MYVIAVPMNTMLIVIIIGVTLFFEMVEINRHNNDIVSMTQFAMKNAIINRMVTWSFDKNKIPLWKTANSPVPSQIVLTIKVYKKKKTISILV